MMLYTALCCGVQTTGLEILAESFYPYLTSFSVTYCLLQTGNWVCKQTETPVKESMSCLIKVQVFMVWSPAVRLEWACSGLTGPGRTKTGTIGVWRMDPDSLSLSETCSESLGVNLTQCQHGLGQSTAQSHRGERTYWAECLEKKTLIFSSRACTLQDVGQTRPVYEQLVHRATDECVHTTKITNQQQQSTPIDIQFCRAWLVIKTMSSAKHGAKNEGIRDTCSLHTFGKLISAGNTGPSRPHIE